MNIRLTEDDRIRIEDPKDIYRIMQRILIRENKIDKEKEHFWVVGMDTGAKILYIELVGLGTVRNVLVEPMNVFRVAILKGATQILGIHNHPSQLLKPFEEDIDITDRLIQSGKILHVGFVDHLIINTKSFVSFKAAGLMADLEKSLKYVPPYRIADKIKAYEQSVKNAVCILYGKNIAPEEIARILNLKADEVTQMLKKKDF